MKINMIFVAKLLSLAVATEILYRLFVRYRDRRKSKSVKNIHEVIMFSDIPNEISNKHNTVRNPGLERIIYYFKSARRSVDVCMFVFTNKTLSTQMIRMAQRGIAIRIILDRDMALSAGSQMIPLRKQGIPVRYKKSPHIMHHKFCVIDAWDDEGGLVMTGSLNWTSNAIYNNWENVIVTSKQELIFAYRDEFLRLWEKFGTEE